MNAPYKQMSCKKNDCFSNLAPNSDSQSGLLSCRKSKGSMLVHVINLVGPWYLNVGIWGVGIKYAFSKKKICLTESFNFKGQNLLWKFCSLKQCKKHVKRFSAVGLHFLVRKKKKTTTGETLKEQGHTQPSA